MKKLKRVLVGFAVAVFVVIGASWLWLKSVESRRWSRMEQRVAELRRDADLRMGPRPVLRGDPVPGNAWDDYLKAIEHVAGVGNVAPVSSYLYTPDKADRTKAAALLQTLGPAVDLMQRGTHRAEVRRARLHEHEPWEEIRGDTPLGRATTLAMVAVCRARFLHEEGRIQESAELLLDVCRFAGDVGSDGSGMAFGMGHVMCSRALDEFQRLLVADTLPPPLLLQVARELQSIEDTLPRHGPAILGELEWFGELILTDRLLSHVMMGKPLPPEARPGWRYVFSTRLHMVAGFDVADALVTRNQDADAGSYAGELKRWKEYHAELGTSKNVYAHLCAAGMSSFNRTRRDVLAKIRLLRIALHHATTGEIQSLEDPFGTMLLHRVDPARLLLWSVGMNEKDDGGTGEWEITIRPDIVLEIPRRP